MLIHAFLFSMCFCSFFISILLLSKKKTKIGFVPTLNVWFSGGWKSNVIDYWEKFLDNNSPNLGLQKMECVFEWRWSKLQIVFENQRGEQFYFNPESFKSNGEKKSKIYFRNLWEDCFQFNCVHLYKMRFASLVFILP